MEHEQRLQLMKDAGVPTEHVQKLSAIQGLSKLPFDKIVMIFRKYGVTIYQILIDLGLLKPETPPVEPAPGGETGGGGAAP